MKILVTGVNGFVGKHLVRELDSRNIEVVGVGNSEPSALPEIEDKLASYYQCDITQESSVAELPLEDVSAVINLAGLANVGASFKEPELYIKVNVDVLSVLGQALIERNKNTRIIAVSTGAVYDSNQSMPLSEKSKLITTGSPYALSKIAMENEAESLRKQGLDCIVARPFNHIGPGQGFGFLIPDLADKLSKTSKKSPEITAGNLKTIRDYSDVRDIAAAYADLAMSETLEYGTYNVCSGNGHSGEDIVKALCLKLDIDFMQLTINTDKSLIRPTDPPKIIGDNTRVQDETGWELQYSLEQTVSDIVSEINT